MYRYDDASAIATLPAPSAAGTPGYFSDGDPVAGEAPTLLRAEFLNMVQEEISNVVVGGGVTLDKTARNQMLLAIQAMIAAAASHTTGDVKLTLKTVADPGWIMADDGSIGSASSSATSRRNADCQALFTLIYNGIPDTYAPVSGGRGASAAADWAANKSIALTKVVGRALAVAGTSAPLSARALGLALGEETHVLTVGELAQHSHTINDAGHAHGVTDPNHTHGITDPGHTHTVPQSVSVTQPNATTNSNTVLSGGITPTSSSATGISVNAAATGLTVNTGATGITAANTGSGTAHNNMQPTTFLNLMIKL